jgi:hypothetical protein
VLLDTVIKIVSSSMKSAPFDKSRIGRITAVLGGNSYSVEIAGADFTVPACTPETYSTDDQVLVLFVQNDSKKRYIIGKAV